MRRTVQSLADRLLCAVAPRAKAQAACVNGFYQCCNSTCTVERYVCWNNITDRWYYGPCVHV